MPSLPMSTWRMSGPAARRGTFLTRVTWPPGSTASRPTTMSSMAPYSVENCPMERVATSPPIWAIGLDCGECPVVRPRSRRVSSRTCRGTPHWTVTIMFSTSTSRIRSMRDPSTTSASSTTVSRPPSVLVPPVRGTMATRSRWANASSSATCSVPVGYTTAAGRGPSKIPCTAVYFRKRSTLLSRRRVSSVSTWSGPRRSVTARTTSSRLREDRERTIGRGPF